MDQPRDNSPPPMAAEGAPKPAPRLPPLQRLVSLAAWLLLIATLAGFAGGWSWIAGLCSPFRMQWAIGAVLTLAALTLGQWLLRWRTRWAVAAAWMVLAVNGLCIGRLWLTDPPSPANLKPGNPATTLTILSFNPNYGNHLLDEMDTARTIAQMIEGSGADIVAIEEITQHRLGVLTRSLPGYRMATGVGRPDAFGIAIFVRRAAEEGDDAALVVEDASIVDVTQGVAWPPQAQLIGRWRGKPVAVLALHTVSAVYMRSDKLRVAMMDGSATWARAQQEQGRSAIVIGDYNATPWCAPFQAMLRDGGLVNSQLGRGHQGSWPVPLPPFMRIPIDHCLHSPDLVTVRREILSESFDSDHLPLRVELQWR